MGEVLKRLVSNGQKWKERGSQLICHEWRSCCLWAYLERADAERTGNHVPLHGAGFGASLAAVQSVYGREVFAFYCLSLG